LGEHVAEDLRLASVILVAVTVATVDHDQTTSLITRTKRLEHDLCVGDVRFGVVGTGGAPPQDDVNMGVTCGLDDGSATFLVDPDEGVRRPSGNHGIERDLKTTVGRVLESHGHGETARHLTMSLALRGASTDRSPGH